MPFELGCYALMSGAMLTGALKRPVVVIAFALAWVAMGAGALEFSHYGVRTFHLANQAFLGRGASLLVSFLLGIGFYLYRHRIPYDLRLLGVAVAALLLTSLVHASLPEPAILLIASPCLVYVMAYLGATRIPRLPLFHRGDYSYGIYLYGVPIAQAVRAALPGATNPLTHFAVTVVFLTLFAIFSWTFIEKPILAMRKRFSFVARARGVEGPGESKVGAPPPVVEQGGRVLP